MSNKAQETARSEHSPLPFLFYAPAHCLGFFTLIPYLYRLLQATFLTL